MTEPKRGQPRPLDDAGVRTLLESVRTRHGVAYEPDGVFSGGEGPGAWSLRSADGPAVLKVGVYGDPSAVDRGLQVLRSRGYPMPRYLAWGTFDDHAYLIQERLPGNPMDVSQAAANLDEIVRLNDLQANACADGLPANWPDAIAGPVLHGGDGFCLLETMREHSSATSDLLDEVQAIVRGDSGAIEPRADVVHFDFTFANILVHEGRISGVIDLEGCGCGDRAFDLVCFVFYAWTDAAVRDRLWTRALELSGPAAVRVYVAHMILRQVEWSVRFHEPGVVRFFMRRARDVLAALP